MEDIGITSARETATGLIQRSCKNTACSTNQAGDSSTARANCCDDSCIVAVALRECNDECNSPPPAEAADSVSSSAHYSSLAKESRQPCASHYKKSLDRYGKILENLGCICKVLLSLNIETCCNIHDAAASRQTCTSNKSTEGELGDLKDASRRSTNSVSLLSSGNEGRSSTKACKAKCCGENKSTVSVEAVSETSPHIDDRCAGKCCDKKKAINSIAQTTTSTKKTCSQKCCSNDKLDEQLAGSSNSMSKSQKMDCCQESMPKTTEQKFTRKTNDCQEKGCCTSDTSVTCSSSRCSTSIASSNLDANKAFKSPEQTDQLEISHDVDMEKGQSGTEHLLLSIQGMTCTGCERKLYRSLSSIPQISNVKTSLLLGQAEFDLVGSNFLNSNNIIGEIERMTDFKCSIMNQGGEEVHLIIGDNANNYSGDPPAGVKEITFINKDTISVTYNPSAVGIRELLSDPFFQRTKLAPQADPSLISSGRAHVRYTFLMTILSAILTAPVLILAWAPLPEHEILYQSISLGLATIVQSVIAGPFYIGAVKALIFSRMIEMDLLIVISTTAAYVYSVIAYGYLIAGKPLAIGEFFETSTLLVTLIMVGRAVSAYARQRATETISIASLQKPVALLIDSITNQEQEIDARLLQYRDIFKVIPETMIVTDGIIIQGETEVDESMITGEATLVAKKPGMRVVAGSINHSGTILVRLTHLPGENTIQTISSMVDKAKALKPRVQNLADRVASYFVPVILCITLIVFVIWIAIGKTIRQQSTSTSCINAMTYAISALIVSCPCAIGLAVPLVVVIASSVAAKHGIIFKTAETLTIARNVSHVIFDKTGTLTQGELTVVAENLSSSSKLSLDSKIGLTLGLTSNSKHPVAAAISTYLRTTYPTIQPLTLLDPTSVPGAGIKATWKTKSSSISIRGGNPAWLDISSHPSIQSLLTQSLTIFAVTLDNDNDNDKSEPLAVFGLRDVLRSEALQVINQLRDRDIQISLVSGDNEAAVLHVARQLDIPESNVRAGCKPEDKSVYVRALLDTSPLPSVKSMSNLKSRSKNEKKNVVLFIGDGTNDAPAIAAATIGLHMTRNHNNNPDINPNGALSPSPSSTPTSGITSDIASTAADAVLIHPSLRSIQTLMDISSAFHRRVVFNFVWAGLYNVGAVLLAAGVLAGTGGGGGDGGVRIPPQFAGLGEIVSVLPVVAVTVGLRWVTF